MLVVLVKQYVTLTYVLYFDEPFPEIFRGNMFINYS